MTLFSAVNLVVGTVRMARLHEDLAKKFVDLEKELVIAGEYDEEVYRQFCLGVQPAAVSGVQVVAQKQSKVVCVLPGLREPPLPPRNQLQQRKCRKRCHLQISRSARIIPALTLPPPATQA